MTDQEAFMEEIRPSNSRWIWLSTLSMLAVISLSGGKVLVASGLLLLGIFAFFNDPLSSTPQIAKPSPFILLSWVCGLVGVLSVVAAATKVLL